MINFNTCSFQPVTFMAYIRFTITYMIKRSAILLLLLALGSFCLLLFASYSDAAPSSAQPATEKPVKCSGPCNQKNMAPLPWNIISPALFEHQG